MNPSALYSILDKHVPAPALVYCFELWQRYPFEFKLRKSRISKVGDFTCHKGCVPRITINHDSHPFLFLITYVHEVAHLVVHQQHGWKPEAHGNEWKDTFRHLMAPLMNTNIFPQDLLEVLQEHMVNPKASSFSDSRLTNALRQLDEKQKSATLLSELAEGSIFGLHGRWFTKGKMKRTRVLCRELKTKRNFLVPVDVPVQGAQLSLL
jgi:SprT protein